MTKKKREKLRDKFAAHALVGLTCYYEDYEPEAMAAMAYEMADAMLKVREEER